MPEVDGLPDDFEPTPEDLEAVDKAIEVVPFSRSSVFDNTQRGFKDFSAVPVPADTEDEPAPKDSSAPGSVASSGTKSDKTPSVDLSAAPPVQTASAAKGTGQPKDEEPF